MFLSDNSKSHLIYLLATLVACVIVTPVMVACGRASPALLSGSAKNLPNHLKSRLPIDDPAREDTCNKRTFEKHESRLFSISGKKYAIPDKFIINSNQYAPEIGFSYWTMTPACFSLDSPLVSLDIKKYILEISLGPGMSKYSSSGTLNEMTKTILRNFPNARMSRNAAGLYIEIGRRTDRQVVYNINDDDKNPIYYYCTLEKNVLLSCFNTVIMSDGNVVTFYFRPNVIPQIPRINEAIRRAFRQFSLVKE